MRKVINIFLAVLLFTTGANAQGYLDQQGTYMLSESQVGDIDNIKPVKWQVREYKDYNPNDKKGMWSELLAYADSMQGFHTSTNRRYIIEIANRVTGDNMKKGRMLLVPTTFPEDFRAYSPYPFYYEAAKELPKFMVVDKYTQTFGAYENGKLVRWGLVSTGRTNDLTPTGRFNFNWKAEYRQSSAAPPGEVWEMYWMFNIHAKYGIHVHQYALPISSPASHGCIRMSEADAKWNFNWANGWVQSEKGGLVRNGTPMMIINDNPAGRAAHWEINGNEVVSLVRLPRDLMDEPAGTYAQTASNWKSGW
jgi:hypothetical protein